MQLRNPFESINYDMHLAIFFYFDLSTLVTLAFVSKDFLELARDDFIWKNISNTHYADEMKVAGKLTTGYYSFFITTTDQYFNDRFTKKERVRFILCRDNNLSRIQQENIDFDREILKKQDNERHSLLSIIKKNNNPMLNFYVFKKLLEKPYPQIELIIEGIKLDQHNQFFAKMLKDKINTEIDGRSLLFIAVDHQSINSVKLLLVLGADPNKMTQKNNFPLCRAAKNGNLEIVNLLLKNTKPADIELRWEGEYSSLYLAASEGHLDVVKCLIEHGADINAHTDMSATPLYIAMQEGEVEVVSYLLKKGADPNLGFIGFSPLHAGALKNSYTSILILLEHCYRNGIKIDINCADGDGSTPLFIAAQQGHTEVVAYLCKQKHCFIDSTFMGSTPLSVTCERGHLEVVKILEQFGPNINHITADKTTPLLIAIQKGFYKIAVFLINKGADVNVRLPNGDTPLHVACAERDFEKSIPIITSLIKAGADFAAQSQNGRGVFQDLERRLSPILMPLENIVSSGIMDHIINSKQVCVIDRLAIVNAITRFIATQNIDNRLGVQKELLQNTFTQFGCTVILYAILLQNMMDQFTQYIVSLLQFQSTEDAQCALLAMIKACLLQEDGSFNEYLFDALKVNVIYPITHNVQTDDANLKIMIYLNLFEAKIEQSAKLTANLQQQAVVKMKLG